MENETRAYLQGIIQFVRGHQEVLTQVQITTLAMKKALEETSPEFKKAYAKHYEDESRGPLRVSGDGVSESLDQLLRRLSQMN